MALSEDEEFELLTLEREKALSQAKSTLTNAKNGIVDSVRSAIRPIQAASQIPGVFGGPMNLVAKSQDVINQGFGKLGEKTAESLAYRGTNPILAAAAGTTVAMAPDIISTAGAPLTETSIAPDTSVRMARRSLGFQKPFLKTPFARGQASKAAKVALENDIISGNPEAMLNKANKLAANTGRELGAMRDAVGKTNIQKVFDNLSKLKEELTGVSEGAATGSLIEKAEKIGGIQGEQLKKIRFAEESLQNLLKKGPEVTLEEVVRVKKQIADTVNWLADNAAQKTTKAITNSIEKSVGEILGSSGQDLGKYNYLKKIYGASKSMIKALNNEVAGQESNMPISLPSTVMAVGEMARGNPAAALAQAGAWELLKRRGAGAAARALFKTRVPVAGMNNLLISQINQAKRRRK